MDSTIELPLDGSNRPIPLISLEENCVTNIPSISGGNTIDCHQKTAVVFDKDVVIYMTGVPFKLAPNNVVSVQKLEELTFDTLYDDTSYIKV
jgi:hypothetical protein